jgi:type VI secretion system protein VasI
MRWLTGLTLMGLLLVGALPASAQSEADVCLHVQAAPEVDLTDAAGFVAGIVSGDVVVTEVLPCEAVDKPMASATPTSEAGIGRWDVQPLEVDPMTDQPRAGVHLRAASGASRFGRPITLTIECTDEGTRLSVDWVDWLGPDELIDVETRIGDGPVTTDKWFNAETATVYGGSEVTFIKSLFGERRLALGTTPVDGPITATFDITGIENAVANVRAACGW